jgi:1-deoxy-D-xylulose-5-phosphate reductoisomerase
VLPQTFDNSPTDASPKSNVAILGATGSIGTAALEVLHQLGGKWRAIGISAHTQLDTLVELAGRAGAEYVVASCEATSSDFDFSQLPTGCQLWRGEQGLIRLATLPEVDTVIAAVVGSAGLSSALAAAEAGKRLALANKEALVVAGELVTRAIAASGGELLPVDSEHSAVFQAIASGKPREVSKIVLTASGGPFRTWSRERIASASVDDALAHPTWQMGRKITIDSATMMNKALEVIEARWLFNLPAEKIEVVVHPQSIVHSMVEFVDGSTLAQLSPPDMRLPIQYALTYPDRIRSSYPRMEWTEAMQLEFEPADTDRFPALELGWEVVRRGGTTGAVLNAANEAAVELFLEGKIRFPDIVSGCRRVLEEHNFEPSPGLEELMRLDRWAREEITKWAAFC